MDKSEKYIREYGYWGEHPDHPEIVWRDEAYNGDTRLGYWDWVAERESDGDQNDAA